MITRPADRLGQLCLALHLSPEAFATRMDLPLHRANRVLRPTRGPSHKLLARVLRTFPEVNPTWLLCGEEEVLLAPTPPAGNYVGTNYGTCIQHIYLTCACACQQTQLSSQPS